MQLYLFSAYHFPVLFQTATFEMQRYLFSAYHFPVFFQKISRLSQKKTLQRLKIQRFYLFPWNVYMTVTKLFNFIDNAAYRFHYTCNNENSCTISFIWLLGYLVEIPPWERGRDRKHLERSTTQHNQKPRKHPKKGGKPPLPVLWRHFWWR